VLEKVQDSVEEAVTPDATDVVNAAENAVLQNGTDPMWPAFVGCITTYSFASLSFCFFYCAFHADAAPVNAILSSCAQGSGPLAAAQSACQAIQNGISIDGSGRSNAVVSDITAPDSCNGLCLQGTVHLNNWFGVDLPSFTVLVDKVNGATITLTPTGSCSFLACRLPSRVYLTFYCVANCLSICLVVPALSFLASLAYRQSGHGRGCLGKSARRCIPC
jgi:hypothetical protein